MMRISRMEVDNFKSLVDFSLDLPKFTCLIGLNGAGKSTILQCLDFLSRLVVRDGLDPWFDERGWKSRDLLSRLSGRSESIDFKVKFVDASQTLVGHWRGRYDPGVNACRDESVDIGGWTLSTVGDREVTIHKPGAEPQTERISFVYEGSILSQIREELLPAEILQLKGLIAGIQALDQLSPNELRRRAREASGTLGAGGRNLSALIHEMSEVERKALVERMRKAYPRLNELVTTQLQAGWKQLEILEDYETTSPGHLFEGPLATEARHINDGLLRVLAVFAELQSRHPVALFDEIENGINPELVELVMDSLVQAPKQIVVTTHSPMILNYLEDEVAKESVLYIYKKADGITRSIPFFDIPSIGEKLRFMGPGEAFVDTDLLRLGEEIDAISGAF
ncbi:AAA family ATPase [Paludisphaera sp.]|uniref:AAA family ATPase n=1 Tax=Paludisphaera sp. TaxID=2017432 RepID=UPI00301DDE7C